MSNLPASDAIAVVVVLFQNLYNERNMDRNERKKGESKQTSRVEINPNHIVCKSGPVRPRSGPDYHRQNRCGSFSESSPHHSDAAMVAILRDENARSVSLVSGFMQLQRKLLFLASLRLTFFLSRAARFPELNFMPSTKVHPTMNFMTKHENNTMDATRTHRIKTAIGPLSLSAGLQSIRLNAGLRSISFSTGWIQYRSDPDRTKLKNGEIQKTAKKCCARNRAQQQGAAQEFTDKTQQSMD